MEAGNTITPTILLLHFKDDGKRRLLSRNAQKEKTTKSHLHFIVKYSVSSKFSRGGGIILSITYELANCSSSDVSSHCYIVVTIKKL
ncbi:hypothetical protein [Candidatus Gillettellia adelgis]